MNKADERIQRWGEKVANSKGSRKSFYVQLDWFEDAEDIRTIAELKEESMFTQFMRISLRTVAPLLLFGDTDGILATDEMGGEIGEGQKSPLSVETRLLSEMRSLGQAISYGLSAPVIESRQMGELTGSTHDVVDEMRSLEERLMAHMTDMFQHSVPLAPESSSGLQNSQSGSSLKPNFEGLGGAEFDYDLDDDGDLDLASLLVDGGESQTGESISKTMVKAALTLFSDE